MPGRKQGAPGVLFFHGNAGEPSEPGFHEAAQLAYDHLKSSGVNSEDIVIYGESIGSGVAVQLAARVEAKALVLKAPVSSATDVARVHYPLLVIHGEKDTIIPLQLGE